MSAFSIKNDTAGAPCKGCEDRHVGCHSTCERYIKSREEHLKLKDEMFQAKDRQRIADNYIIEKTIKRSK